MRVIANIFNNTIHKKFNRKIGTLFCILCLVSSSLWVLSASAENQLGFNNKASLDALWAELKTDISDLQSKDSNQTFTTPVVEAAKEEEFCETMTVWIWSWQECKTIIITDHAYPNNQQIYRAYEFPNVNAVSVTLKGETEYSYDYIELNGQRYSGSLDQTVVIDSNQITLGFVSDTTVVKSGVTVTLDPIDRTISTMIDILDSAQSHSNDISFLDFISALKTLENTAKGTDSYPQVKEVIAKYQDNLHHITQWLTADSQLKARAAYEPEALMELAYHIQDKSLLQRLERAHSTESMDICLSGISLECMVDFGDWLELKADIAMDLKQQGETLHTDHAFHGALQAASDHLDRYSYNHPRVQTGYYNNDGDGELADEEFEVDSSSMGGSAAELLRKLITIGNASESAFIKANPAALTVLSILNQYSGNSIEEKLAAWGAEVSGQVDDQSLDHIVEEFSKPDLGDNNKILRSIFHNLSLSSANTDDFTYWLYAQNQWNVMNLDVTDLEVNKHNPEVILDGINYNSEGKYSLAPKPDNNNGWSIQDKAGHFTGKITLKKQAGNGYVVKRFADSSVHKFSEVKFYSPDPCSDNPNHYKLTSYWSNQTGILTDIGYDCFGSEPVLAVVNKYSAPNYNPDRYDRDHPLPKDFDAWQESLYFNSISYNDLPVLESIIHHQKDGQGQQYSIHPLRYEPIDDKQDEESNYYLSSKGKILANLLCDESFRYDSLLQEKERPFCYANILGNNYSVNSWWTIHILNLFSHVAWKNTNLFIPTKVGLFKANENGVFSLEYPLPVIGIEREAKGVKLITKPTTGDVTPDPERDYIDLKMQDGQYVPNYLTHTALEQGAKNALANHGNDHVHYFENHQAIKLLLSIANADKFPITDNQLIEELIKLSGVKNSFLSSQNQTTIELSQYWALHRVLASASAEYLFDNKELFALLNFMISIKVKALVRYSKNKQKVLGSIKSKLFEDVKKLKTTSFNVFSMTDVSTKKRKKLFISKQVSKRGIESLFIMAMQKGYLFTFNILLSEDDNKKLFLSDLRVNGLSWSDWYSMDHTGFDHYFDRMGLNSPERYKHYLSQVVDNSQPLLTEINTHNAIKQGAGASKQLDNTGKKAVAALWNAVIEYCPTKSHPKSHHRGLEGGNSAGDNICDEDELLDEQNSAEIDIEDTGFYREMRLTVLEYTRANFHYYDLDGDAMDIRHQEIHRMTWTREVISTDTDGLILTDINYRDRDNERYRLLIEQQYNDLENWIDDKTQHHNYNYNTYGRVERDTEGHRLHRLRKFERERGVKDEKEQYDWWNWGGEEEQKEEQKEEENDYSRVTLNDPRVTLNEPRVTLNEPRATTVYLPDIIDLENITGQQIQTHVINMEISTNSVLLTNPVTQPSQETFRSKLKSAHNVFTQRCGLNQTLENLNERDANSCYTCLNIVAFSLQFSALMLMDIVYIVLNSPSHFINANCFNGELP